MIPLLAVGLLCRTAKKWLAVKSEFG